MQLDPRSLAALLTLAPLADATGGEVRTVTVEGSVLEVGSSSGVSALLGATGFVLPHVGLTRSPAGALVSAARISALADLYSMIEIDAESGAGTFAGSTIVDIYPAGLAFDATGTLYAIGRSNTGLPGPLALFTLDLASGDSSPVTLLADASGAEPALSGLAWSQGTLFSWNPGTGLVRLDVASGAVLGVGAPAAGPADVRDLAFDAAGDLFAAGGDGFLRVDPATGATAVVSELATAAGDFASGLAFQACDGLRLGAVLEAGTVNSGLAGQRVELGLSCAQPSASLVLLWGLSQGSFALEAHCPGLALGIADPRVLELVLADGSGVAHSSTFFVPPGLSGTALFLQAVDIGNCDLSELFHWKP